MAFVGAGGSYTVETTYKYVGAGAGTFELVKTRMAPRPVFMLCTAVVVVVLLAVLLIVNPFPTTTTTPTPGPRGSCVMWGDPHFETFDHSFPNFYEEGEYWVVKKDNLVKIQGRYLATPFTNGLSATHQIAVGGDFLQGHTIVVGPMENGQILVDGQPAMQGFPSTYSIPGVATLSYNGMGQLVDDAQSHLEKHIVHMDLPLGVHLQVMRWANHLNVKITMNAFEGMDGGCGNFNGQSTDDSTQAIKARIGERIPHTDLLFHHAMQVGPAPHKTIADCPESKRTAAMKACAESNKGMTGHLLDDCVFDTCFGGEQYAAEDGMEQY